MKLLHGTSTKLADDILDVGLDNPFLTDEKSIALYFAEEAVEESGGEPVILEVEIFDKSKLRPDLAMYQEPLTSIKKEWDITSDGDWLEALGKNEIPSPANDKDWETSLETVSSVVYKGHVSPDQIDVRT